jgi:ankyrin repeat protein
MYSGSGFALEFAVKFLQPHVVELLIKHGANIHHRQAITDWTLLVLTDYMGSTSIGDEESSDEQIEEEDVPTIISIVKMLSEAGADINAHCSSAYYAIDYEGDTALNLCCEDDEIKVVELLLSSGALLDVQRKSDGRNALLHAAEHNNIGVVELLIRAGADTTLCDRNGRNYIDFL